MKRLAFGFCLLAVGLLLTACRPQKAATSDFVRVENGHIKTCGRTDKKDREYVLESAKPSERRREAPARDTAKKFILDYLESGESKPYKDVEEAALAAGISKSAFKRVKCDLEREGRIEVKNSGYGKEKKYFWTLKEEPTRGG